MRPNVWLKAVSSPGSPWASWSRIAARVVFASLLHQRLDDVHHVLRRTLGRLVEGRSRYLRRVDDGVVRRDLDRPWQRATHRSIGIRAVAPAARGRDDERHVDPQRPPAVYRTDADLSALTHGLLPSAVQRLDAWDEGHPHADLPSHRQRRAGEIVGCREVRCRAGSNSTHAAATPRAAAVRRANCS